MSGIEASGRSATAEVRLIGGKPGGANGEVSLRKVKECCRVDDLSVSFLRSALEAWADCERARKDITSLRREVEKSISEDLQGFRSSRKVTECMIRRLRGTLPDRRLIRLITAEGRRPKLQLRREVVAAAIACGFEPPSEPGRKGSPA